MCIFYTPKTIDTYSNVFFSLHTVGQSSRTESSNQLDATEEDNFDDLKQRDFSKPLTFSSKPHLSQNYSENRDQMTSEESSSISSSEEEEEDERVNLKKSRNSHEPVFIKVS